MVLNIKCICDGEYEIPALAVDILICVDDEILLVERGKDPFIGKWALPGGFVERGEKVEEAAKREAREETGVQVELEKLIGVFSDPDRDPRGHVVSIVYSARTSDKAEAGSDAAEVEWFNISNLPPLAFDHEKIIKKYIGVG
ncbi:MAG: NUDIX family hydrolase [Candidatus Methanohalarchaeum thermophilum]|uniref:NUDIX family hydrolase n=1 Tax=Methanohalarchaeum thermophilum TaxID=1903181 RepID=A0A1Q6DW35_METT1|nr:MAG: NUDIX family hydrolase [Candidatus Methanohalarchaeum thermophilum]